MANPQLDNGHTDLAHDIVEALMRINITSYQYRVLWCIIRKTYGWHRKTDHISYSQFMKMTEIADARNLARTIQELKGRQLITIHKNGHGNVYGFQKNYELWDKPLSVETTSGMTTSVETTSVKTTSENAELLSVETVPPLYVQTMKPLSVETSTKEKKEKVKETLTKESEPIKLSKYKRGAYAHLIQQ